MTRRVTTSFFMSPSRYSTVDEMPLPENETIRRHRDLGFLLAVKSFYGNWTESRAVQVAKCVHEDLKGGRDSGFVAVDEKGVENVVHGKFNPPWTISFLK